MVRRKSTRNEAPKESEEVIVETVEEESLDEEIPKITIDEAAQHIATRLLGLDKEEDEESYLEKTQEWQEYMREFLQEHAGASDGLLKIMNKKMGIFDLETFLRNFKKASEVGVAIGLQQGALYINQLINLIVLCQYMISCKTALMEDGDGHDIDYSTFKIDQWKRYLISEAGGRKVTRKVAIDLTNHFNNIAEQQMNIAQNMTNIYKSLEGTMVKKEKEESPKKKKTKSDTPADSGDGADKENRDPDKKNSSSAGKKKSDKKKKQRHSRRTRACKDDYSDPSSSSSDDSSSSSERSGDSHSSPPSTIDTSKRSSRSVSTKSSRSSGTRKSYSTKGRRAYMDRVHKYETKSKMKSGD